MNDRSAATARPSVMMRAASGRRPGPMRAAAGTSPACTTKFTASRAARNATKLCAPLATEDLREPLQQLRTLRLVLRVVEDEKLQFLERWIARRGREIRAARILPAVDQDLLARLAHPPIVEKHRRIRMLRILEQAHRAKLGRHAFRREAVIGRLAELLRAPCDVVVRAECDGTLAAFEQLADELRRRDAQRLVRRVRLQQFPSERDCE